MKNKIAAAVYRTAADTIEAYHMIEDGAHIVVGLSGGADSVCLFDVLCRMAPERGLFLHPVHVNHMLRGEDADEDQAFCEALCRERGFECRSVRQDCAALAERKNLTLEEAGRRLRYDIFGAVAGIVKMALPEADVRIALAQHADDRAETVLLRILRGTGPDGLIGIPYTREDEQGRLVIRPLLDVTKEDILAYCEAEGLSYRTDLTNLEPVYSRNRVRLRLIPELESYNPNIRGALNRLAQAAAEDRAYLEKQAAGAAEQVTIEQGEEQIRLSCEGLKALDPAVRRRVLGKCLASLGLKEGMTFAHFRAIGDLLESDDPAASCDLPAWFFAARRYGELILGKRGLWEDEEPHTVLRFRPCSPSEEIGPFTALFDLDKLGPLLAGRTPEEAITLRYRQPGDVLPLKSGRKRLQDLFVDMKIPREVRKQVEVAAVDHTVLMIRIPYRDDIPEELRAKCRFAETFSCSRRTKKALMIEMTVEL
ncbi:MAG: tRNA lysidine(34) synthetase TilS [Eubacterium sp.]|nr:tRNA lysidine(34) synthetase TilS [Eubacterium sp.]